MSDHPNVSGAGAGRQSMDDGGQRIRTCSIPLSSGSSRIGNLEWSDLGQALVVTEDSLVILSPLSPLNPALVPQSRAHDVECHPRWQGRFPHSLVQINVQTFLENEHSLRSRIILEADHSAVDPRFLNLQWTSATWSKPGMGPHGSCLILATTSELDLFVLGAPRNAWTGEWRLLHAVDLQPVAGLAQVGLPKSSPASSHAAGDRDIFTRSRALLRKKQMATEVLCAAFIDLPSRAPLLAPSTYIIAGTRSGHLAVWECHASTGHCTFLTATAVSNTAIEQISLSVQAAALEADAQARIAFQDAGGIRLCDFYALEDHAVLQLIESPSVRTGHCMVTAWHWSDHRLLYATIGAIHIYDVHSAEAAVFALVTDAASDDDPYLPVVAIEASPDPAFLAVAILQDLRKYHIPPPTVSPTETQPTPLLPVHASTLLGYPPLTESLQRKHDFHQAFLAYRSESGSSLASASLIGAIRTDERVAFLGYNVSDTLRYQLELVHNSAATPERAIDEALGACIQPQSRPSPPYLFARTILALLATSSDADAYRSSLHAAIQQRWQSLLQTSNDGTDPEPRLAEGRHRQGCLLFILACRLSEQCAHPPPALDALRKKHKGRVLYDWLQRQLSDLTPRLSSSPQPTEEDRKLLTRFSVAARMLPAASFEAQEEQQVVVTEETCAACQAQLTMRWDEHQNDFGWAKCQNGHVWRKYCLDFIVRSQAKTPAEN